MLGAKIKRLRIERSQSQEEIASMVGVSRQTLSKWERDLSVPDSGQLPQLAKVLGTDVSYLLSNEEAPVTGVRELGNDEIVAELVRLNDSISDMTARRREITHSIITVILVVILVLVMIFVILIIFSKKDPHSTDVIEVHYSYDSGND